MRGHTLRLGLALGLLGCLVAPAGASAAASRAVSLSWSDGGRGVFNGTLSITGFALVDDQLVAVGRLTGTTTGRHNTGIVDQAVTPQVLDLGVIGSTLHREVGPLEARGSTTDAPQTERIGFDLPSQSGYVELQIADALRRGSPRLHLLRLLDRVIDLSLPGPVTGVAGKCLDVAGANRANGTPVQLYECNGTDAQQWTRVRENFHGAPNGTLHALDKCLDVSGNQTANGTRVQLWDCNGTTAQKWGLPYSPNLLAGASGKCLDAVDARSADGTKLQIWECHGGPNQQWIGAF